jgi:hypothetical protein
MPLRPPHRQTAATFVEFAGKFERIREQFRQAALYRNALGQLRSDSSRKSWINYFE